jgi:hypothetical protein
MNITIAEAITNFKYKQAFHRAFNKLFYTTVDGRILPKVDIDGIEAGPDELTNLAYQNLIDRFKRENPGYTRPTPKNEEVATSETQ